MNVVWNAFVAFVVSVIVLWVISAILPNVNIRIFFWSLVIAIVVLAIGLYNQRGVR